MSPELTELTQVSQVTLLTKVRLVRSLRDCFYYRGEVESFFSKGDAKEKSDIFSLPAVLISLALPLAGVVACAGHDMNDALGVAGSFGSPLLYGILPAMMAMNQRKKTTIETQPLVPGGMVSVGALGLAAVTYIGEGLASRAGDFIAFAS
jgi:hypothetical protein